MCPTAGYSCYLLPCIAPHDDCVLTTAYNKPGCPPLSRCAVDFPIYFWYTIAVLLRQQAPFKDFKPDLQTYLWNIDKCLYNF